MQNLPLAYFTHLSLSLPNVSITTRSANSLDAGWNLMVGGTFLYSNVAVAP